jgi:probable HAF family extracellular repeat protein
MEDLGTLGGARSAALGISDNGVVVGISETGRGTEEAFIWTRGGGMRSLGEFGGGFGEAHAVNTHRRVVGRSLTAGVVVRPFLWTPERGLRRLPTLSDEFSHDALDLNEFGAIAGYSSVNEDDIHAALWTPTAGPLLAGAEAVEERSTTAARQAVVVSVCAFRDNQTGRSRFWSLAIRACLRDEGV